MGKDGSFFCKETEKTVGVMIYHTLHTMSLDRCVRMLDSEDMRLVARVPLVPVKGAYKRFLTEFGKTFNERGMSKLMRDELVKIKTYNRIYSLLPSMMNILWLFNEGEEYERAKQDFKNEYGKEFEGGEDLMLIVNDIRRQVKKYNLVYREKKQEDEGMSLGRLAAVVGMVMGYPIPMNITVHQFKHHYDLALDKIEKDG